MVVDSLGGAAVSPFNPTNEIFFPPLPPLTPFGNVRAEASSASVFHSLQASHLPAHFG
jgi:hypothetical protein